MVNLIFDRNLLQQKRARAQKNFTQHEFLHERTWRQLEDRLGDIKRAFQTVLKSGAFGKTLNGTKVIFDEEYLPVRAGTLDAFISALDLHSINDLPGALLQIRRALKPDGVFLGAMFGGETLYELRESLMAAELEIRDGISPRIFPFATKQDMGALLQRAGFALPVTDSEIITVTYADMFALLHDLRGMGESNIIAARDKNYAGRNLFFRAAEIYAEKYAETDGRIPASFEILYLIGWAPHESQQKPLQPGSAEKSLADALETEEIKT